MGSKRIPRNSWYSDPTFSEVDRKKPVHPTIWWEDALADFAAGRVSHFTGEERELLEVLHANKQAQAPPPKETTLYRFFDAEGHLLYVGISWTFLQRLDQHRDTKYWWKDVATATFEHVGDRREALRRETEAINTEHPRYNGGVFSRYVVRLDLQAPDGLSHSTLGGAAEQREYQIKRRRLGME